MAAAQVPTQSASEFPLAAVAAAGVQLAALGQPLFWEGHGTFSQSHLTVFRLGAYPPGATNQVGAPRWPTGFQLDSNGIWAGNLSCNRHSPPRPASAGRKLEPLGGPPCFQSNSPSCCF